MPIVSLHAQDQEVAKKLDIFKDGLSDAEKIENYVNVDAEKLKSYFELRISVRNRTNGESVYSYIPFRQCTKKDSKYDFKANDLD